MIKKIVMAFMMEKIMVMIMIKKIMVVMFTKSSPNFSRTLMPLFGLLMFGSESNLPMAM